MKKLILGAFLAVVSTSTLAKVHTFGEISTCKYEEATSYTLMQARELGLSSANIVQAIKASEQTTEHERAILPEQVRRAYASTITDPYIYSIQEFYRCLGYWPHN